MGKSKEIDFSASLYMFQKENWNMVKENLVSKSPEKYRIFYILSMVLAEIPFFCFVNKVSEHWLSTDLENSIF